MNISREVSELKNEMLQDKDYFNAHPELGFEEFNTSRYVEKKLNQLGFKVQTNIAKTGIVGMMGDEGSGETVLFRADMDSVMTVDQNCNNVPKHLCGHDAHMAILLALASLISKNAKGLKGVAKLVFQPGEEGCGGAETMLCEGVLHNPTVNRAFALHVWSEFPAGQMVIQDGPLMASGDEFIIDVIGQSAHGALPEKGIDAIFIASNIVTALQSIASRSTSPLDSVVISIGYINGGCNHNTIADRVTIKGTCRTFKEDLRLIISEKIKQISTSIASAFGGSVTVEYLFKHPVVVNDPCETALVARIAEGIISKSNIITNYRTMCTEDYSHFLKQVPGALILVGCKGEKYFPQHHQNYYVKEAGMVLGLEIMYGIAKHYLIQYDGA